MEAPTSIARALAFLRQGKPFPLRLEGGVFRAAHLLCFLRYVEDNAAELGLRFEPTEMLSSVGPAYGTAFFPPERLAGHVGAIASRLGMDGRAFAGYVNAIASDDMRAALGLFDLADGDLNLAAHPGAGDEASALFARAGRLGPVAESASSHVTGLLVAGIVRKLTAEAGGMGDVGPGQSKHRKGAAAAQVVSVVDPMCGQGGFLHQSWDALREALPSAEIQLSGWDTDATAIALTSMRLLLAGYRGPFAGVRIANPLDTLTELGGPYDVVVCEPPYTVDAPTGTDLKSTDGTSNCLRLSARLLKGGHGVGIVVTSSRALSGPATAMPAEMADRRGALVNSGCLYACVELTRRLPTTRPSIDSTALWVLRGTADSEPAADSGPVLLARLDGDGLERERPGFYEGLVDDESEQEREVGWLADLVAERHELPYLSTRVAGERILASEERSLRLTDYAQTVDVAKRLGAAGDLTAAREEYRQARERLEQAHAEFDAALDALVAGQDDAAGK